MSNERNDYQILTRTTSERLKEIEQAKEVNDSTHSSSTVGFCFSECGTAIERIRTGEARDQ